MSLSIVRPDCTAAAVTEAERSYVEMALRASVYREALRQLIDAAETYTRNPDTGSALSTFYDALDRAEKVLEADA
jgi:hypothetical protein